MPYARVHNLCLVLIENTCKKLLAMHRSSTVLDTPTPITSEFSSSFQTQTNQDLAPPPPQSHWLSVLT